MEKKSVYLVQANYEYAGSMHLPYAIGMLKSFADNDERVSERYHFEELIFKREDPQVFVEKLNSPAVIGFSCYVWNYEYNKAVAKLVKEKYPECKIIFGGHHVTDGDNQLKKHSYIDVLIHSEGEEAFRDLLLSFVGLCDIENISNISYRKGNETLTNPTKVCTLCDYPSPYIDGTFDSILKNNPQYEFIALIETNRGCPYSCAYCDWGCLSSKLRLFPMERIQKEIDWLCEHKIKVCGSTDANFGIIERDVEITDMLTKAKREKGYPKLFQTSYAKNSNDRVFRIGKKFEDNGMSKGVTISFQTMSDVAAKNMLRKNIPVSMFSELMNQYNSAGIPTYTELILGLPGETLQSFKEGINTLLEAGQHYALYVHNCELLPCSTLASKEFIEKFGVEVTKIPLNEPHHEQKTKEIITEYSRIVTKTNSMSENDWIEMNVFSYVVQAYHHLGLLRFVSMYLNEEKNIRYDDFYSEVIEYLCSKNEFPFGKYILEMKKRLKELIADNLSLTSTDERFGVIDWPFEELLFLRTIYGRDSFYEAIRPLIVSLVGDERIADAILYYQKYTIKYPEITKEKLEFEFDFPSYFSNVESGKTARLEEKKTKIIIEEKDYPMSWDDYARFVVWYGRKASSNFFKFRKED